MISLLISHPYAHPEDGPNDPAESIVQYDQKDGVIKNLQQLLAVPRVDGSTPIWFTATTMILPAARQTSFQR